MIWFQRPLLNHVFLKRQRRLIQRLIRNHRTSGNRRPYRTPLAPPLANHRLVFSHFGGGGACAQQNQYSIVTGNNKTLVGMKGEQNKRPLKWLPLKTLLANASESNQSGDFNWTQQQELIVALNQSSLCCLEGKKRSKFIGLVVSLIQTITRLIKSLLRLGANSSKCARLILTLQWIMSWSCWRLHALWFYKNHWVWNELSQLLYDSYSTHAPGPKYHAL